jgi:hypothetical protein
MVWSLYSILLYQTQDVVPMRRSVYRPTQTDEVRHPAKTAKQTKQTKQTTCSSPTLALPPLLLPNQSKTLTKSMLILSKKAGKQLTILLCYVHQSIHQSIHPSIHALPHPCLQRQEKAEIEITDAYRTNTHYIVRPPLGPWP